MCGIFAYLSENKISNSLKEKLISEMMKSQHRGPDNTKYRLESENIFLGFHRLCVNDITERGDQPLTHPNDFNISLICNGEIYNYQDLKSKYNIVTNSTSDCEIILHLYKLLGFEKTINELDGVFACVLVDLNKDVVYVARDPIGVRSLYMGELENGDYAICSEMKSLHNICDVIQQFPTGSIWDSKSKKHSMFFNKIEKFYNEHIEFDEEKVKLDIYEKLNNAVKKRLMSDRKIGIFLSGGFDSSILAALLKKNYNKDLETFSIGLTGSTDLKNAKIVAEHIGSNHHEIIITEQEMLNMIDEVIYQTETYDTTTIRASTPMYILSKYIKNNTDIAVVYSGEGSDEASGSYLYFHNAPNKEDFKNETVRLMQDLKYFDVLRCDKSTAGAGLEVRVPFLDKEFLEYYMNIDPKFKLASYNGIEKYLLRSSFDRDNLLPKEILWRMKEGMSDGVSSQKRGWYQIIQEHVDKIYSDMDFDNLQKKYDWNPPMFKEALHYREIFNKHFSQREMTIPYYWLPKWSGDIIDPSARVLTSVYKNQ